MTWAQADSPKKTSRKQVWSFPPASPFDATLKVSCSYWQTQIIALLRIQIQGLVLSAQNGHCCSADATDALTLQWEKRCHIWGSLTFSVGRTVSNAHFLHIIDSRQLQGLTFWGCQCSLLRCTIPSQHWGHRHVQTRTAFFQNRKTRSSNSSMP